MFYGKHFIGSTYDILVLLSVTQQYSKVVSLYVEYIAFHQYLLAYVGLLLICIKNDDIPRAEVGQEVFPLLRYMEFDNIISFRYKGEEPLEVGPFQWRTAFQRIDCFLQLRFLKIIP